MPFSKTIEQLFAEVETLRLSLAHYQYRISRTSDKFKSEQISGADMVRDVEECTKKIKDINKDLNKVRDQLCDKIRKLPDFKQDKRFANMKKQDASKLEKFYETVNARIQNKKSAPDLKFEEACKLAVVNYDEITELYGDAWPEAFSPSEKLSSIFVNHTLRCMNAVDCKTGETVTVSRDNLRVCSYSASEADTLCEKMMGNINLDKFHGLISVAYDAMDASVAAVQDKIAENPELSDNAFLDKDEITSIADEVVASLTDLEFIDDSESEGEFSDEKFSEAEISEYAYRQVALGTTSYANSMSEERKRASDMFEEYDLPIQSEREITYEQDGAIYWVGSDGSSSESDVEDEYESDLDDMEEQLNYWHE